MATSTMTPTTTRPGSRNISRWDPFSEMDSLFQRFNRLFGLRPSSDGGGAEGMIDWAPTVDIKETDANYLIEAELPGVEQKDVSVEVRNGVLTISGERNYEQTTEDETCHRIERAYGRFNRSFSLPDTADDEHIQARFDQGLLRVTLPKRESARSQTRNIPIGT